MVSPGGIEMIKTIKNINISKRITPPLELVAVKRR
jgi:hypothetical protein